MIGQRERPVRSERRALVSLRRAGPLSRRRASGQRQRARRVLGQRRRWHLPSREQIADPSDIKDPRSDLFTRRLLRVCPASCFQNRWRHGAHAIGLLVDQMGGSLCDHG